MRNPAQTWINTLADVTRRTVITADAANAMSSVLTLDEGLMKLRTMMQGQTTYLIGNGGSLTAAMHFATDFNLAGLKSVALCDPAALTSHANDFGVVAMFTKQLECAPTRMADVLICLSCSGKSPNIIDAARYAHAAGMRVVTFTGFEHDNPLRSLGELNFYTPASQYGFVQLAQETLLHAACDMEAWRVNAEA